MKIHVNYYPSLHPRVLKMDEGKAKRSRRFLKPKHMRRGKNRRRYPHMASLPQRNPKNHPQEEESIAAVWILMQRNLNDRGIDCDPMESRHDKRQWLKNRAKKRYWNNSVMNSCDSHNGDTEACVRRAQKKWNTVSRNGNNLWATRGRRGPVAQRAKAQVRRNRRRKMQNYTRSVGREALI